MDADALIDKRRLRRKLFFWRATAILVALAGIASLIYMAAPDPAGKDHIARISITGLIQDDEELVELIDEAAKSETAKAIVISISTPGGTTYGGEKIHKALVKARESKPVVADVRTLAASAGYMIAASTDHIVAGESSIVGSIGVIFQYAQVSELLDKVGVQMKEIKSAPLKAEPSPFHPASPAAEEMIRSMVLDSYDWFVDMVAAERKMDRGKVLGLADGSIFTGRQSLTNGLVDAIGGEAEIRAYLKSRDVADDLEIVKWQKPQKGTSSLLPKLLTLAVQQFTGAPATLSGDLERLGGGKMFLDGLVSVWQVASH